jgi:hypothetical protein
MNTVFQSGHADGVLFHEGEDLVIVQGLKIVHTHSIQKMAPYHSTTTRIIEHNFTTKQYADGHKKSVKSISNHSQILHN